MLFKNTTFIQQQRFNLFGMQQKSLDKEQIQMALRPESPLEFLLLKQPEFKQGLAWGVPRYGHPEGEVYKHIQEVLGNIDRLQVSKEVRTKLRLIAYVHDTFKYCEDKKRPRDWSKHHAVYARKFLEQFLTDSVVLDIVELHDEAYYAWCSEHLHQNKQEGSDRMDRLRQKLGQDIQLYYLFFKCDTKTGDKNLAPLYWFEEKVEGIQFVDL